MNCIGFMKFFAGVSLFVLLAQPLRAEEGLSSLVFVDSYVAGSRNDLSGGKRAYFTQASRDDQPRLNLASAGLNYDSEKFRARLIGQFGDSVDLNYAAEPQEFFRYVQESFLGTQVAKDTWLDVGTFMAHIGSESWLSKDNPTYTRSFLAEFSPYYETGVRLGTKFSDQWSGQLLLVNGWQNTTDNRHPALGTQVRWEDSGLSLTSNTFLGSENYGTRAFHNLNLGKNFSDGSALVATADVGYQSADSLASGWWWGYTLIGRVPLHDRIAGSLRVESYQDPDSVIVSSATGQPFRAHGVSVGTDVTLGWGFMVRGEIKQLMSSERIYLDGQTARNNDTVFVVSLSFSDQRQLLKAGV